MASRLSPLLRSRVTISALLCQRAVLHPHPSVSSPPLLSPPLPSLLDAVSSTSSNTSTSLLLRHLSTVARRQATRARPVDIGARARQLQSRRLWTYALTFSCIAGFIIIVLNNFQDALVFYITPSEALEKFAANPTKNRFRLGGLVLEGSVVQPAESPEMEFVITDLLSDILVRYEGSLPDLFREGHSVVVEGSLKPFEAEEERATVEIPPKVSEKARTGECYFKATEVLAKHDEKYMPKEVGEALERNRKKIEAEAKAAAEEKKDL